MDPTRLRSRFRIFHLDQILLFLLVFLIYSFAFAQSNEARVQYLKKHLNQTTSRQNLSVEERLSLLLRVAGNERERAWLIYQWVTKHFRHDAGLASRIGDPSRHSLDDLYKKGGGSCAVYADVLHRLLEKAGLEVKTIYGTVKGNNPMSVGKGLPINHVWNVVKVDGEWRTIDATWGSGYVDQYGFQREQSDLFFLISPEVAVLSHFDQSDSMGFQRRFDVNSALFAKIPENAIYVAALGFSPNQLLQHARRHANEPLVNTFDQAQNVFSVVTAPLQKRLNRSAQSFKLKSAEYEELVVVQGKSWTPMKKNGLSHSITLMPVRGELVVMGRRSKQYDYEALLAYSVK